MSKVICDICGTQYPESAEQCPICGYARTDFLKNAMDDSELEDVAAAPQRQKVRGGRFSTNNVRKRNRTSRPAASSNQSPKNNQQKQRNQKSNGSTVVDKILNILLVIVILALLAVSAYIFIEYFMPNVLHGGYSGINGTPTATQAVVETTEPSIPCTALNLRKDYSNTLKNIGDATLLNVEVTPQDTTDELKFESSDESVLVVSTQGRVTAVGKGEAVVTITCGQVKIDCKIVSEGPAETTEPVTEAPTEALPDVKLAIDKSDFTLSGTGSSYTLQLKCELKSNQVKWTSDNEKIAKIDENGKVTAVGKGTTKVYAKYGEQVAECVVRCK